MAIKSQLLEVLNAASRRERAVLAELTEAERAAPGAADCWCTKDIIAHVAVWNARIVTQIGAALRGEPVQRVADIDQANAAIWAEQCGRPWSEIERLAGDARAQLLALVETLDEKTLTDATLAPDWLGGQLLWQRLLGNAYTHANIHYADIYTRRGEMGRIKALYEEAARLLDPLDDSPRWRGTNRYNIACGYALAGMKEQALATLGEALQMRPDLKQYARDDTDFTSIRQEPAFLALIDTSAPGS